MLTEVRFYNKMYRAVYDMIATTCTIRNPGSSYFLELARFDDKFRRLYLGEAGNLKHIEEMLEWLKTDENKGIYSDEVKIFIQYRLNDYKYQSKVQAKDDELDLLPCKIGLRCATSNEIFLLEAINKILDHLHKKENN